MILLKGSQRRVALLLGIDRKTVARKVLFLGIQDYKRRKSFLKKYEQQKAQRIQFDDIVTFEHTKCKPVAISLMVEEKTRKILDFEVSQMSANGLLAEVSRKKYGRRKDQRLENWRKLFKRSQSIVEEDAEFKSDEHPWYPGLVKEYFPKSQLKRFKGRRGCVVGQGELKSGGFDPLFSLNHTAAMLRDSLAVLVRRTWCTTKKLDNLKLLLEIYIQAHNCLLT